MPSAMKRCLVVFAAATVLSGCNMQEQKQMEQANKELKTSVQQNKELLAQSQEKEKKQAAVISSYQEKLTQKERQVAKLEMLKVELRKQKEFTESELTRQKFDAKKQAALAENYKTQVKTLNDQLAEARAVIQDLRAKIQALSERPATKPAGK